MDDLHMPPFRVGHYIDTYLPTIDGVVITVANLTRCLPCESFIATASAPRGYNDRSECPVYRYASVPFPGRSYYRVGMPWLDVSFQHDIVLRAPNLVHAHTPLAAGSAAMQLARKLRVPLVASFHSKYYDDIYETTHSKALSAIGVDLIVNFYNRADCVWTVNEGTARTLRDYGYKREIDIIPNGVSIELPGDIPAARARVERRFHITPDTRLMLYIGQHILQKNLMLLLEGVARYARMADFMLLMVGDGPARDALEARAAELGISDRVLFAGKESDRNRLAEIYSRADLFMMPSKYDNAPLVIREAAAAGCPSLLLRGSNAAERAEDGVHAYLCDETPDSVAEAIHRAFSDDESRRAVGQGARRMFGKTWEEVAAMTYARYTEISARHTPISAYERDLRFRKEKAIEREVDRVLYKQRRKRLRVVRKAVRVQRKEAGLPISPAKPIKPTKGERKP